MEALSELCARYDELAVRQDRRRDHGFFQGEGRFKSQGGLALA